MTELELKQAAYELRNRFGLSDTEPVLFKNLFLKEKILAYHTPLDESFSGMAVKAGEKKFILVNSNHPLGRQNFTICHELYHLYVDKNFETHKCQTAQFDKTNKNEYAADTFASHFLLPEQGLLSMIPKGEMKKDTISLSTIVKIEQYFGCSRRALVNRLKFLKIISPESKERLCMDVKKSAQLHGYSVDLYSPGHQGELWGDYGTIARNLFENEKISEGHYAALMADIGIDIFNTLEDNGD